TYTLSGLDTGQYCLYTTLYLDTLSQTGNELINFVNSAGITEYSALLAQTDFCVNSPDTCDSFTILASANAGQDMTATVCNSTLYFPHKVDLDTVLAAGADFGGSFSPIGSAPMLDSLNVF